MSKYCPLDKFAECNSHCAFYLEPVNSCSIKESVLASITLNLMIHELVVTIKKLIDSEVVQNVRN